MWYRVKGKSFSEAGWFWKWYFADTEKAAKDLFHMEHGLPDEPGVYGAGETGALVVDTIEKGGENAFPANTLPDDYGTRMFDIRNTQVATGKWPGDPLLPDPFRAKQDEADPNYLELAAPQAAFRKFLGTVGYSPTERFPTRQQQVAQAQYDPLSALFVGQQVLGGLDPYEGTEAEKATQLSGFLSTRPSAETYLQAKAEGTTPTAGAMPTARAGELANVLNLFSNLRNRETPLTGYQEMAIRPETVTAGRPLANIGLQALGQSISPLAAQYFNLPSQEELATRYLSGSGIGNYADFIKRQLGIGGIAPVSGWTPPTNGTYLQPALTA